MVERPITPEMTIPLKRKKKVTKKVQINRIPSHKFN